MEPLPPDLPPLPPPAFPPPRRKPGKTAGKRPPKVSRRAAVPVPPTERQPPPPAPPVETPYYDFRHLAAGDDTHQRQAAEEVIQIAAKIAERKREALKLYEPLPVQAAFHASRCHVRLLRGSNRGGKTLPAAIEVARAVTRQHGGGRKYPDSGMWYVVGKDWAHVGETIYKKLFLPGAFKVIKDRKTKLWRAFRPWDGGDQARRHEAKKAPPLIPPRFIAELEWYQKKALIPLRVKLTTGWEIKFFSGLAKPPQGSEVDGAWLDEEITDPDWFPELTARVADREGCLVWSATPQNGTVQFFNLSQQAAEEALDPNPTIEEHVIKLADNPHISERAKANMAATMSDEDQRIRIEGEFSLAGQIIYPEFNRMTHGIEWFAVPDTWTNYAVVDPGHQILACLFASVPNPAHVPPEEFNLVLFDELYIPKANAHKFGAAFKEKTEGRHWHQFIIDMHGAKITDIGSGKTAYDQYCEQLKLHNVRSEKTGHSFAFGSDSVKDGISQVRSAIMVPPSGKPKVRVMVRRNHHGGLDPVLRNFEYEIQRYVYKRHDEHGVTDEPEERGRTHLMACLRYLVMAKPRWHNPVSRTQHVDPILARYLRERARGQPGRPRITHFGPAQRGDGDL